MVAVAPLYLIADRTACRGRPLLEVVEAAVAAGVRWVQYREKALTRRARYDEALRLRELTRRAGAVLIVNDELDLAVAVDADGLHLGQDDLPLAVARRHVGTGRFIGISTHTLEEARAAAGEGADYLAVGPIFATATKTTRPPVGCEAIRRARAATSLPLVAIGGITPDNVAEVLRAGADSAAVISALCGAEDLPGAVDMFRRAMGPTA
jgi:thiamine-phosphate pyrophosphorylase